MRNFLIILLSTVYCLLSVPTALAQVQVSALVPSNVSVENSEVKVINGDLVVLLKDEQDNTLSGKVVEANEEEIKTDESGEAIINQISNIKNQPARQASLAIAGGNDISKCKILNTNIVADRVNNIGEFGYCEGESWFKKIFKKASAQEKGLTLTPATVSVKLPAGEVTTRKISVTNTTGEDGNFEAYLSDYKVIDESGNAFEFLPTGTQEDSMQKIVAISPVRFDLKNNESKEIELRIAPANSINQGRYKGAIFVSSVTKSQGEGTRLAISQKVGTLVGVEVTGVQTAKNQSPISSLLNIQVYWKIAIFAIIAVGVLLRVFGIRKRNKSKIKHQNAK